MSILTKPQGRIPIAWVTVGGQRIPATIDIEWDLFLSTVTDRAGGVTGVSTTELAASSFEDAGIPEMHALMFGNEQGQNQRPPVPEFIQEWQDQRPPAQEFIQIDPVDNSAELRARVDALETEIQALKQGFQL